MKRTIYALCTVVCALFVMTSCSKSDDDKGGNGGIVNNNFSSEVTAVASKETIQKMAAGKATIYGGTTPPEVKLPSGFLFHTGEIVLSHTTLGDKDPIINKVHDGFFYKFYNQNGSKLKVDYFNQSGRTYAANGVDAVISGEGNKFTIFFLNKERDLVALSGEFTEGAINGFQWANYVKVASSKSPEGTVRIFKSKSGRAERAQ
ncbi:hypothetical protein [Capnocytophaga sputigena]|uniref:hypothetical protein n=1 Tax=Capnocytophaga sputigena TaxID=1019 RepID=UPI0031F51F24